MRSGLLLPQALLFSKALQQPDVHPDLRPPRLVQTMRGHRHVCRRALIDDPSTHERPAVIDAHHHGASGVTVCDGDPRMRSVFHAASVPNPSDEENRTADGTQSIFKFSALTTGVQ
jgi:hypothetical protein